MRAVVLGAGPAGLAAAQALVEGGAEVTVLEAASAVGGLAKSHRIAGHWVDVGPHRLHLEASPTARRLLGGAGGLTVRRRRGRIHLDTRHVDYPLSPLSTLRGLGVCRAAHFALSAATARSGGAVESYASETRRRVGDAVYRALYAPAARKIWGRAPEALDASQAQSRVGAESPARLLGRVLGRGEPGRYLYPADGANGFAYLAWARALERRGVVLLLGTRAEQVLHGDGRVRGVCAAGLGELPADRVVSTLPLPALGKLLRPALPRAAAPGELAFRSVVALYVVLGRSRLGKHDVHYCPSANVPFARLTEQAAFGRAAATPAGETVVTLDLSDDPAGPLTRASAGELLELVLPSLSRFGIHRDGILGVERHVASDAYPVMTRGHRTARDAALDAACAVEGLLTTGRAGLFLHVNQHHAIEMGTRAGARALGAADVSAAWRAELGRFDECRVVD